MPRDPAEATHPPGCAPSAAHATAVLLAANATGHTWPISSTRPSLWDDRLELLLQSTGDGIYGIDLDSRCTFINRSAARMLGYRPEDVLGRHMHDLMHHSHADGRAYPECDCPILRAFRLGQPCRVDTDVLWRADGTSFPAEYSSYPIVKDGRVLGAVIAFADITDRKRAEELLLRANELLEDKVERRTRALSDALAQVRELSAHLETVREDERTRIAREIHDELGSLLVGLKLDVAWVGRRVGADQAVAHKCRSMTALVDRAVENVGRIITDLRPSVLDNQGLWAALEWQAAEFAEVTEIACKLQFSMDPVVAAPKGAFANAVFRIFQEMLNNVARHAQARHVDVRVMARPDDLTIEVQDDGRGCDASSLLKASAHGVLGMRERARHLGGTVTIEGAAGTGTLARLRLPREVAA
jgi:PAS domain S-box-containing protein